MRPVVRYRRSGFSMVEVMVSMVLIGVVSLGSAGFYTYALDAVVNSRVKRLAFDRASSRLDELRSGGYEDVVSNLTGDDLRLGEYPAKLITTVTVPVGRDAKYREVAVTVRWQRGPRTHEVSVVSLVADAGRAE